MLFNFLNNDDWVYIGMVRNFLKGNFALDPLSAPTFYTQGLIGVIFSKIFGIENIPYLTIIISFLSLLLFYLILRNFFNLNKFLSFVVSLFLLFNPLFLVSSIGFMTENYFLLLILICLYLFLSYEKTKNKRYLYFLFISLFLGLNLRQVALVFPLSMFVYFFIKRDKINFVISFVAFLIFYSYYGFIFPKTAEMHEKPLLFSNLLNLEFLISFLYPVLIVLVALTMPLILNILISHLKSSQYVFRDIFLLLFVAIFTFLIFNKEFNISYTANGEFPYFANTWEREGLFAVGIFGTKYQLKGNYDLYYFWDLASKILIAFFIPLILFFIKKRNLIDFNLIFCGCYFIILFLTPVFYDRYLLVFFPFFILFLVKNINFNKFIISTTIIFLVFLGFYSYQLILDFVITNNYVWSRAEKLAEEEGVERKDILVNHGWKMTNRNLTKDFKYEFSFDSSSVNPEYRDYFYLLEEKTIDFPGSIFVNPKIYFYQKR